MCLSSCIIVIVRRETLSIMRRNYGPNLYKTSIKISFIFFIIRLVDGFKAAVPGPQRMMAADKTQRTAGRPAGHPMEHVAQWSGWRVNGQRLQAVGG
jgi:hypothetical protein